MKDSSPTIIVGLTSLTLFNNHGEIVEHNIVEHTKIKTIHQLKDITLNYELYRSKFNPEDFSGINHVVHYGKIVSTSINKPRSKILGLIKHIIDNALPNIMLELSYITRDDNGNEITKTSTSHCENHFGPLYYLNVKRMAKTLI